MFQGHCGRTGGRRDGSGGESEGGLQVFMDLPSNGAKVCNNESNSTFSGKATGAGSGLDNQSVPVGGTVFNVRESVTHS